MLYLRTLAAVTGLVASAAAATLPRSFSQSNANGFPKPNDQQIMAIAEQAGGKLPPGSLPSGLDPLSITTLQLVAFNELFEVAYFSSLLNNLTSNASGYDIPDRDAAIKVITAVRAQEQLHALGALAILENNKAFTPSSCEYAAPVANFADAISLAETFTAVVLGALQGAALNFAMDAPAVPLVHLFGSIIGQEGEQNGAYRQYLKRIPSESPFLTAVPAPFAWSALQLFVVPGSCPYPLSNINLPIFPPLSVNGGPVALIEPGDQILTLSADLSTSAAAKPFIGGTGEGLYATFTTGQQAPASIPLCNARWTGNVITFEVNFPYTDLVAHGFSHVALTTSSNFTTADDVPNAALAGPGVIQVNNSI